ncbi:phosphatase PAP2 family protein [Actinomycetospora sp. CA-101289]|uniref:phosphatase PAP2 family protein n=1 Tax=Actinomycetospora sp. CA-101289 TaxID=3239893 RepID=UPI003D969446
MTALAVAGTLVLLVIALVVGQTPWARRRPGRAIALAGGIVVAVLAVAVGELVDQVVDQDGLTRLDGPVWGWFVSHRDPAETTLATGVSDAGATGVVATLAMLVAVVLFVRRHRAEAVLIAVVVGGSAILVVGVKDLVGRPRPPVALRLAVETNASFPSGHALVAAAVLGVLAVLAAPRLRGPLRALVAAGTVLIVLAIGLSRLYLAVHWASDVLTGWLLGVLWLTTCLVVHRVVAVRQAHPRHAHLRESSLDTDV